MCRPWHKSCVIYTIFLKNIWRQFVYPTRVNKNIQGYNELLVAVAVGWLSSVAGKGDWGGTSRCAPFSPLPPLLHRCSVTLANRACFWVRCSVIQLNCHYVHPLWPCLVVCGFTRQKLRSSFDHPGKLRWQKSKLKTRNHSYIFTRVL